MDDVIRSVLAEEAKLLVDPSTLGDDVDLYDEGLTSHATVNIMLALEDAFDIEFPDRLLRKQTFTSIRSIRDALHEVRATSSI